MIRNTTAGYGWAAIVLHWLIALIFVGQFGLGIIMSRIESQRLAFDLIQLHKSFGFLLLGLVLVRIGWRLGNVRPDLPATLGRLETIAARIAHALLYAAMVVVPVSGWALVSVSILDIPSMPFSLFVMPNLPLEASEAAEGFWDQAHEIAAWLAMGLVCLHALAALRHHVWLKDDVLRRMTCPKRSG